MKKILKKLYFLLLLACILLPISFIVIDYLGVGYLVEKIYRIYKPINILPNHANLYEFDYYKQKLTSEPYFRYGSYPHPYYLTANPFKIKEINEESVTKIVSLDKYGFRNSFNNNAIANGIFLGGSSAFGVFASSNFTTINSQLNKKQNLIQFHNRAVPSWNSHQEMISILKNQTQGIKLVIAFSGWNDFGMYHTFCKNNYEFKNIAGAPSIWIKFESIINNEYKKSIKERIIKAFPISLKIINKLSLLPILNSLESNTQECNFRKEDIDLFVSAYLQNYKRIKKIVENEQSSEFINAKFHLILQPFYQPKKKLPNFGDILNTKNKENYYQHYNYFINKIIQSEYCSKSSCLNLTRSLNSKENENPMVYQNIDNIRNAYMVDPIHFTDRGNDLIAEIIYQSIFK